MATLEQKCMYKKSTAQRLKNQYLNAVCIYNQSKSENDRYRASLLKRQWQDCESRLEQHIAINR